MNRRILTWATRIALICATSVALIGPALAVHATTGSAPRAVADGVAKAAAVTASIAPVAPSILEPSSGSTKVYITRTGKKYHRSNCRTVRQSKTKVTLKYAKAHGYGACKVCKPPKN